MAKKIVLCPNPARDIGLEATKQTMEILDKHGITYTKLPEGSTGKYSMVGFRICNTLSENGSVARGVCEKNDQNMLTGVVERTEIMRVDGPICYKDEEGAWQPVGEETPVSMNFWGFTPDYFKYSEEQFVEFLKANASNPKSEFFIPLVIDNLINT